MTELIIHATTKSQLDRIIKNPAHALLLLGLNGIGKGSIARELVASLLRVAPEQAITHAYVKNVEPANDTISIDQIREVQKFLQLKTVGTGQIRRIVCLEHADALTPEAQNALLKLLEEPPADTVIILTAQHKRRLLPTILSRVQTVQVLSPTQDQLASHFSGQTDEDVRKAYLLSGGLPGLMQGILADDQSHPLLQQVVVAKDLLRTPAFERLAAVDALVKQKESLDTLLSAFERIAQSGLAQAGNAANTNQIKHWHALQKEVFLTRDALAKNANPKLALTNMFLNF